MTLHLPPYPTYKPSGVDWLGDVPAHWRGSRLRYLADITTGERDTIDREDNGKYPFFVRSQTVERINTWSFDEEAVLTAGDGHVGKIFHYIDGKFDFHQRVYKFSDFRNVTGKFFFHYIKAALLFELLKGTAKTTVESIRLPMLKDFPFVIPPFSEQRAIARYLDHVDRRIQRYIEAKEQMIAFLQEARQAIIQRAVTRGLDPDVPLKPSGVDWLGDVPAHWEVRRLRYLIDKDLTYGANAAAEYDDPTWPRYLRITDFATDGTLRDDTFRSLPPEIAKDYLVQPGDLLLARSGATVGKAFLVTSEIDQACHAGYLIRARPKHSLIEPKFLFAFTQSSAFTSWKDSTFIISTIQNISAEKYANLTVPTPPLEEQERIVSHLDQATAAIDSAIDNARRQTEHMAEYRASLIAHVVTGKLDVRAAAAQLPADSPAETPVPEQEKIA